MRYMYDADNPYDIPRNAEMVAGYLDGPWTMWRPEWWALFPEAQLVGISAVGDRWDANVYDLEPGCIWPPENSLPMYERAWNAGLNPTAYCNERNHWGYVRQMFQSRGLPEPPYWVSNYDGDPTIPAGAIAKQFENAPMTGHHFDGSSVAAHWPGVDEGDTMPSADEIAGAVVRALMSDQLYILDMRPGVPDSERHHTTFKNALWSTWHTMHYGDEGRAGVAGLYPSNKDIVDAVVASGVSLSPEQMAELTRQLESGLENVVTAGVQSALSHVQAVYEPRQ